MTEFLAEAGKQLAGRWAALLALPAVLFVAAVTVAATLGQAHSLDVALAARSAARLAARYEGRAVPAAVAAVGLAIAVGAASVIAQGIAAMLQRGWLAAGTSRATRRIIGWRTDARRARWLAADTAYTEAARAGKRDQARLGALADARNRIALAEPARPTWIGDRLAAAGTRVWGEYGLDMQFGWPRLWLVLPEPARQELRGSRDAFTAATVLQAWGVMYTVAGGWWWPAAVAGIITAVLGWRRGRASAAALADLVEAAFDLYSRDLAAGLNGAVPAEGAGGISRTSGELLSERLRKGC